MFIQCRQLVNDEGIEAVAGKREPNIPDSMGFGLHFSSLPYSTVVIKFQGYMWMRLVQ